MRVLLWGLTYPAAMAGLVVLEEEEGRLLQHQAMVPMAAMAGPVAAGAAAGRQD